MPIWPTKARSPSTRSSCARRISCPTRRTSVTIDEVLMRAADILPYEKVAIWDATNGARIETYALPGEADSGIVCVNGAAARLVQPGDVVILATFAEGVDEAEAKAWKPTVIRVDGCNRILAAAPASEIPGPGR